MRFILCLVACFLLVCGSAYPDLVDFESGYTELQNVSSITTATNEVGVSTSTGGAFIARAGDPLVAFGAAYGSDTVRPADQSSVGSYFLSDESGAFALSNVATFYFSFANPIESLALDILDLDQGIATLRLFSDAARTVQVGFQTIVGFEDGRVDSFLVNTLADNAVVASLETDDVGVAIDNLQFTTASVPEPSQLFFWSIVAAIALCRTCSARRSTALAITH